MKQSHSLRIAIAVATHKAYWMPKDPCYVPLQVGKALHPELDLGIATDATGDAISAKNASYCELTALYWLWKNVHADVKGLVHYRRHFTHGHPLVKKHAAVLKEADWQALFATADIVVPERREYYIETNRSHYVHAHGARDLIALRESVARLHPEALSFFDVQMGRTSAHMFNMMVMRAALFDAYCAWLFPILADVEQHTDLTGYDAYQRRAYGFLSELLLDVWLDANGLAYRECPVTFLERQNWLKKGGSFLMRKFLR